MVNVSSWRHEVLHYRSLCSTEKSVPFVWKAHQGSNEEVVIGVSSSRKILWRSIVEMRKQYNPEWKGVAFPSPPPSFFCLPWWCRERVLVYFWCGWKRHCYTSDSMNWLNHSLLFTVEPELSLLYYDITMMTVSSAKLTGVVSDRWVSELSLLESQQIEFHVSRTAKNNQFLE